MPMAPSARSRAAPATSSRPGDVVMVAPVAGVPAKGDVGSDADIKTDKTAVAAAGRGAGFTLCQVPEVSGALVVIDPHTGRVLAMSGGFSFAISQFDRATQAIGRPGRRSSRSSI